MRHERRTMEMNGKCHKIGRAAAAFVLSGSHNGSGRYYGHGCRSGAGAQGQCGDSRESGRTGAEGALLQKQSLRKRLQWRMGSYSPRIWKEQGCGPAGGWCGTGRLAAWMYIIIKSGEAWEMVWKEAGIVGRKRNYGPEDRGDGSTPSGTYGFTMAFGLRGKWPRRPAIP